MTGTSSQEVDQVTFGIEAQQGSWVPVVNEAVCGSGIECPVQKSSEWTFNYALEVDGRFADGNTLTRWKLSGNSDDEEIICAEVQLNIA